MIALRRDRRGGLAMSKFLSRALAGVLSLALSGSTVLTGDHPVQAPRQHLPPAATPHAASSDGTLFLVGGGKLPDSVRRRFLELAGGKKARLVVIPSASARPDAAARSYAFWLTAEVASLRVLYTTRRDQSDDVRVYGLLRDATGVWIAGGDQSRLTALYGGTRVERELAGVLRRGGVVGGTSAGASVVSGVMMDGGKAVKGFGLLTCCVVDQHFSNRHRLARLLALLHSYPCLAGIGIDEETAVVIRGGEVTVLGNATVTLATADPGRPVVRVYRAGSHFRRAVGVQRPAPGGLGFVCGGPGPGGRGGRGARPAAEGVGADRRVAFCPG
jgi:cyanophycinase